MALGPAEGLTKDDKQPVLLVLGPCGAVLPSQRGGQQEGQSGTTVDTGALPGEILELPALELREAVHVYSLGREERLLPPPRQPLHGGEDLSLIRRADGHVEDVLLLVLHFLDVLGEAGRVLGHTELDVGGELGPEGGVLAVGGPHDHVQYLPDDFEDLVLPQRLPGGVEEHVVTAHDCPDKAEASCP